MKKLSKILTGAATAAMITVSAAAPAEARHSRWDRHDGIDVGDVITGVAVVGGIAAIASAIGNSGRYNGGYVREYPGYGYGGAYGAGGERGAVNACVYEAQRRGAQVYDIDDVDRDGGSYRVRGDVRVRDYDYDGRGYGRSDIDRENFTCTVARGQVYDFRISGDNRW